MINKERAASGFTLLELLIVIGLIAGLSVVVARSFVVNDSARLREAEVAIGSLLRAARAEALGGTRSRVLVLAEPGAPEYLAKLAVVSKDSGGGWKLMQEPIMLPSPVKLVPESGVSAAVDAWPPSAVSVFSGTESLTFPEEASARYHFIEFTESGGTASGRKLVVGLAEQGTTPLRFLPPETARAFIFRVSGTFIVVREVTKL